MASKRARRPTGGPQVAPLGDRGEPAAHAPRAEPKEGSPLPAIVAEADDLEAIRKAVEAAAAVSAGLWLSYLFVLFYVAIAAGAVTHVDLLLENPVKLPFLGIELPLLAFFFLAPLIFLISHAYTLVHFVMLASKALRFHDELRRQVPDSPENPSAGDVRSALRRQLPSDIFVQFLAGPEDIRDGSFGRLLKAIAWTTLVVGPILLLLLLQIQFLPYHDLRITWTHRLAILADLLLIWWLWRKILGGRGDLRGWRSWTSWTKAVVPVVASIFTILFSWTVATIPDEWQESHLPSLEIIPTDWQPARTSEPLHAGDSAGHATRAPESWFASTKPTSLHKLVFNGGVDSTTRRRTSLSSNTLVLPGFDIHDALKIDDPKKVESKPYLIVLRGRRLDHAIMSGATLTRADLTGAFMEGAALDDAQLQGASLEAARLQGAHLDGAKLQGASLEEAQLQGAHLDGAQLQGAWLDRAQLQGALLDNAELQGASLIGAQLQGASLSRARLQGTSLAGAQLQAAHIEKAQLQGAWLDGAQLQGALLVEAQLQGASLVRARLQGASLIRARIEGTSFDKAFFWRTALGEANPKSISAEEPNWRPEYADAIDLLPQPWTNASSAALRQRVVRVLPPGRIRESVLDRMAILDCDLTGDTFASCDPAIEPPAAVREWQQSIERMRLDEAAYHKAVGDVLDKLVCSGGPDGIHVLRGLLASGRMEGAGSEVSALVAHVMSPACPVFAALTDEDRAGLRALATKMAPDGGATPR